MTVREQYFDWLSSVVNLGPDYSLVLGKLFDTEFVWTIPFDAHRASDGINLRYRFGRIFNIPDPVICSELDHRPCSILEMIVALAIRCEEQIMSDAEFGDRTPLWLHDMLGSLGLLNFPNRKYDESRVSEIIDIFLRRDYSRTGKGGLFEIPNLDTSRDMRTAEIWWQMCWYCDEHIVW